MLIHFSFLHFFHSVHLLNHHKHVYEIFSIWDIFFFSCMSFSCLTVSMLHHLSTLCWWLTTRLLVSSDICFSVSPRGKGYTVCSASVQLLYLAWALVCYQWCDECFALVFAGNSVCLVVWCHIGSAIVMQLANWEQFHWLAGCLFLAKY